MNSSSVLKEILELRTSWRRQNLTYTSDQRKLYEELSKLRKEIVRHFYATDRVWIGPSTHQKPTD